MRVNLRDDLGHFLFGGAPGERLGDIRRNRGRATLSHRLPCGSDLLFRQGDRDLLPCHTTYHTDDNLPAKLVLAHSTDGPLPGGEERRNPVRPFRQPLLGVAGRDPFQVPTGGKACHDESTTGTTHALTEEQATRLRADVLVLLDGEHPSDAIRLLEAGLDRAVPGSVLELQMQRILAAALLIDGQYSRAAQLFKQAGNAYRQHLGAADPWALDCAYQAGHAYAQAGKPDKALPQLRYYVMNAASLAARDADEAAKVMESRLVIAQLLASTGEIESALAELRSVRPLLLAAYGPDSAQIRNLDKQATRLQAVPGRTV